MDYIRKYRFRYLLLFILGLSACDLGNQYEVNPELSPTTTIEATIHVHTAPPPTAAAVQIPTITVVSTTQPAVQVQTNTTNLLPSNNCLIGSGLRHETIDILLENKEHIGLIMAANSRLAEMYFPQFEDRIRVLGAPSLDTLREKAERARVNEVPYEALGYGLETSRSTPAEEWRDLVASTLKAKALADEYNKLLVMGPGFLLMSRNEEMYAPMATIADIWIFQTQQLQKGPPGLEYRQDVERIIKLIRTGNPDIGIWAQITLPPDREPDAEEWLEYRNSILDLVEGTFIGVYTWDIFNQEQILNTLETILGNACIENQ
jgi:hypothetical protein